MKSGASIIAVALAAAAAAVTPASAAFICSTVAAQGDADPDAQLLGSRFADDVDCNGSGDTVLVAQASGARDKLYLYENGGAASVVARANGPSVTGQPSFRASNVFRFQSLNDAGDVAFRGALADGVGVFVRRDGFGLQMCARDGTAAPGGGTFDGFSHVSELSDDGAVAFVASVTGGVSGVYGCECDGATCNVFLRAAVGGATLGGNEMCSFTGAEINDSDLVTRAAIAPTCADPQVAAVLAGDGSPSEVAVAGAPCPIPPGGTYSSFQDVPKINASSQVGYQARCGSRSALFLDGIAVVQRGDAAPVGGTLGHLTRFQLASAGELVFRTTLSASGARFCNFRFDGLDEDIVCNDDAPPFGVTYSNIRDPGASRDGDWACARVRVKGAAGTQPRLKSAVVRCEG